MTGLAITAAVLALIVYWLVSGMAADQLGRLADKLMPDDERVWRERHDREHWD